MSDANDKKPIEPPKKFPKHEAGKRVLKGAAGTIPVAGGAISEGIDALFPDPASADHDRWSQEITSDVNSLNEKVEDIDQRSGENTVTLEGAAALAAKYMIEKCPDGLRREDHTLDELIEACPEFSKNELLDGLGELELYGLVTTRSFIGSPDEYRLTDSSYEVLDEHIMEWSTSEDARHIARLSLEYRDGVKVRELHDATGWTHRRFNPAQRMVVDFIAPGRVSQAIQPEYVTRWFSPNNVERASLRLFAGGAS